jgi:hypothetical protein
MKARSIVILLIALLSCAGTSLYAKDESADERPYIGIRLDPTALPDLLIKHLGLSADQGVRIRNIQRSSPADRAGLERDDIVIGFQGEDVTDHQEFIDAVRNAGVGTEVSLDIIHLGKRKTVKLKLEPLKGDIDWKYPSEPEIVTSWFPGKIFRLKPGDRDWIELNFDDLPNIEVKIDKVFRQVHTYHHTDGDESYTVTIEGNPNDEDTKVTVRSGDSKHSTTVKGIETLPEKYRSAAKEALQDARESSKKRNYIEKFSAPYLPREAWKRYQDAWKPYSENLRRYFRDHPAAPRFGPGDETFENIQKQMRELQKRMEELEEQHRETLKRFDEQLNKQGSTERKEPTQPEQTAREQV